VIPNSYPELAKSSSYHYQRTYNKIPKHKEHIKPIPNILQRNRRDKSIQETGSAASELEDAHAFGALDVVADFPGQIGCMDVKANAKTQPKILIKQLRPRI
jgi:hypothetical protein